MYNKFYLYKFFHPLQDPWSCVQLMATVKSDELLARLEIDDLDVMLRETRLHWFGHVERSSGAIKTVCSMQIEEKRAQWAREA